ncbi:transglycosylase SLT domain-containing protein [Roseovarius sp. EL26]|uniref:transglycosylase SLT domain-containing protein n=1 Tax=Roseovarius sp. EL26 TaxID=2126672 RepID=UPI0020B14046|nr:transglycosylase SLT domain-containing protein [Roseovarius sp. EL26]
MKQLSAYFIMALLAMPAFAQTDSSGSSSKTLKPPAREGNIPRTRWEGQKSGALWTRASLAALKTHGAALANMVPADVTDWCPAYPEADLEARQAFWVGLISSLVKHESTFRQTAVGGGGRWYGLLQITPSTAQLYKCNARSGAALKDGVANLNCGIRIMAKTVPRDGVVSRGMKGVAADWGPFYSSRKRNDMMAYTRAQTYCKPIESTRPKTRPKGLSTPGAER